MGSPIVVMGVSGSGKSTVGAALGQRLRVPFADADDFHPPANIEKMSSGQALDDGDRHPWVSPMSSRCRLARLSSVVVVGVEVAEDDAS
jgi:carbohydrate kinase (thermoresistant glucokinase family)